MSEDIYDFKAAWAKTRQLEADIAEHLRNERLAWLKTETPRLRALYDKLSKEKTLPSGLTKQ